MNETLDKPKEIKLLVATDIDDRIKVMTISEYVHFLKEEAKYAKERYEQEKDKNDKLFQCLEQRVEKEKEKWEKLKEWIGDRAPGILKKDHETSEDYVLIYLDLLQKKMKELEES